MTLRLSCSCLTLATAEWHLVATSIGGADGARLHARIPEPGGKERFVSVLRWRGNLFALDSVCYHAGGPLTVGDIEEIEGRACVLCPWHAYPVELSSGDKLYRATVQGDDGRLVLAGWKSVGKRQRTHDVEERPEGVFLRLRLDESTAFESDSYAHNVACGVRCTHASAAPSQRSGAVLANSRLHSSRGADGRAV